VQIAENNRRDNMKLNKTHGIIIIVLFLSFFSVKGYEPQPSGKTSTQLYPKIYGDIVVWEDDRHGDLDIYGYNIEEGKEFLISRDEEDQRLPAKGDQFNPAIGENYVVWQDKRNGNWDIYRYNLETQKEFPIIENREDQIHPAIYQHIIVWEDTRDHRRCIYWYNFSTEEGDFVSPAQYAQSYPAIYGTVVVWREYRYPHYYIYGYDLSIEEELSIATNRIDHANPAIYKDIVVWEDGRNGNWDIYGYNLETQEEFQITEHISDQLLPAVYGDIVVWQDSRNDNVDIYGYDLETHKEFPITEDLHDQFYPAIYKNIVVWEDKRSNKRCIYYYDLSTQKESPIPKDIEEPESRTIVIAGVIAAIFVLALILGMYKKYPHLFKRESSTPTGEEIKSQEIYEVNPLKDPLSNFLFTKKLKYFFVLFLLIILQIGASISSETLTEVDVDSFPREKVPFLKEEVLLLSTLYEPVFIIYSVTAGIIFFLTRKFLLHIPDVFKNLFNDGIIRRKKGSTVKNVLADFNGSLRKFEKELNGSYEYVPGIILCILGCLLCCWGFLSQPRHIALGNLAYVSWRDFCFFRTNWAVFVVVSLSMFFILGIFIWKMYKVVSFIKQINNSYELVLKPYDVDGSGGFGPLEQLWLNMSFVAMPILVDLIILSILGHFWGSTYYPLGRSFDLLLTCIFIIALLVRPILTYHRIVENQKANLLGNIENKIDNCYRKIEKALSEEEEDLEGNYLNQLKQFQEIAVKVKSIPSLPLKTYQKVIIFLGAFMPLIINSIIGWSREVITWIMQYF
jgi:TolB protein